MAWAVKYRCEFKDLNGIDWKVEIEEDAYGGSVIDLVATDNPLLIEWNKESDDVFDPIQSSKASLSVWSQTSFALTDLYSSEDFKFRVKIYEATVLYWQGYIITDNYSEPYIDVPYPVTITASCGLEQLKNQLFKYKTSVEDDTYYDGRTFESRIIINILGKVGYTGFTEYVNLYEETMNDAVGDSPFDQLKIDVDLFKDMYCDEVLKEVLKKYNACIIHKAGTFVIYRPVELTGATVYGRIFTAYATKSATTFTSVKYIDRTAHPTSLKQIPGGVMMIQRPAKKVTLYQDYGNKESWIENWEVSAETWNGSFFKYWDNPTGGVNQLTYWIPSEINGFVLPPENDPGTALTWYVTQSFGTYSIFTSEIFSFEFEYIFNNYSLVNTTIRYYIEIKSDDGDFWLYVIDDVYAGWTGSQTYIGDITLQEAVSPGISGWKTFKRNVYGLPISGAYTITIYSIYSNNTLSIIAGFKNFKFYSTSNTVAAKSYKESYFPFVWSKWKTTRTFSEVDEIVQNKIEVLNAIGGKDIKYNYLIGDVNDSGQDNVIEQFAGSLAVAATIGYTGSTDKIDTVTISGGGAGDTGDLNVDGIIRTMTWLVSDENTIDTFLVNESSYYTGFTLTKTSSSTFTVTASNYNFPDVTIGSLLGTATNTTAFIAGTPVVGIDTTNNWNSRGGSEDKPVLEIVADEIADQYSRPKQLVQMAIFDDSTSASAINILAHFEDDLNQVSGNNRTFVMNRGEFYVKGRRWMTDLIEII